MLADANIDSVYQYSEDNSCGHHISAARLSSPIINRPTLWPEIKEFNPSVAGGAVNLACSERGDLATEFAKMISNYIQFPKSTAFMHCLGCVSAAMTRSFKVEYGGSNFYANLYIVTAQPPSTGKSAINDFCFIPVADAYKNYNEKNANERIMLEIEIRKLEKHLDNDKNEEHDIIELLDKIEDKKRRHRKVAFIKSTITNATIEALERETGIQGGMFNVISDEADSINVVLGAVYGDESRSSKANSELILKGWDNGHVSSTRIGRDGLDGRVRGTISVLAQANSVDTILAAGASGRGIAERFFLLNEPSLLGSRDKSKRPVFDKSLHRRYASMIANIVSQEEVIMNFTADADEAFNNYDISVERKLGEMGDYSHNLFTGFMGKSAKQCRKLAAVLHTIDNWEDGGQRSLSITDDYAFWAISIFDELGKTFRDASDSLGHVGSNSEVQKLIEVITKKAEQGRLKIDLTSLRNSIKNVKPFAGSRNLQRSLKERVIPALEQLNYCVLNGNTIYINPRLK
tara:strand:- start:345 stop:1898 length:1554 start_codon:yes stop_codon:yes gene_type:complete